MCRFVAYLGNKSVRISSVLIKPTNSLVKQSLLSRESTTITNGDGFGLGWYTAFDKEPALFTSLYPAWNDQNLSFLAQKTKSSVFFGHVRAASCGGISQFNCHPFLYKQWMLMHNGGIPFFELIKRDVQELLDDEMFRWIKGNTDSEVIFALFLHLLKNSRCISTKDIALKLQETIKIIERIIKKHKIKKVSQFNICITDGNQLIASRYSSSQYTKPETLYVHVDPENTDDYVMVASEKFHQSKGQWRLIPVNTCLIVEPNLDIHFMKFKMDH